MTAPRNDRARAAAAKARNGGAPAPMTGADMEALALALPGAAPGGHFSARDVRVSGRIFASLPEDGGVVVRLTADQQAAWRDQAPGALAPIPGRWAGAGWTRADPARLNREQAARLVRNAWENVAPKPTPKSPARPGASRAAAPPPRRDPRRRPGG
ncbi:MAG: MmcQ/YjbR family DNA-binding protein [Pseudomonadota bacterium]|nr:MmcQ/YjbR family DNA-binding protein [Pseudomonadota bacterium]